MDEGLVIETFSWCGEMEAEANSIMDEMNAAMVENYKAKIKLGTLQTKSRAVAEKNHHQLVVCSRDRDGHDA